MEGVLFRSFSLSHKREVNSRSAEDHHIAAVRIADESMTMMIFIYREVVGLSVVRSLSSILQFLPFPELLTSNHTPHNSISAGFDFWQSLYMGFGKVCTLIINK